jgi:hypothetical protein
MAMRRFRSAATEVIEMSQKLTKAKRGGQRATGRSSRAASCWQRSNPLIQIMEAAVERS